MTHPTKVRALRALMIAALLLGAIVWPSRDTMAAEDVQTIRIGYIRWSEPQITLSLLDMPTEDDGLGGARMAVRDNNTTGQFTKQAYELVERNAGSVEEARAIYDELVADGVTLIVADLPAEGILALADASDAPDRLIFNVSAPDDVLRGAECRANVVHTAPSHAMLADGLAQYLVWKRWPRWMLLTGALPQDKLWADALRRAALRFGADIVEEREYASTDVSRRVDSGHTQVQRQIPVFTQDAEEHDVVVVADESEIFATYIPYRTWDAKPVAGSAGLMPTSWTPAHEQWGAYQMQNRFYAMNKRLMRELDANAWVAVRIIGEAATRTKSGDATVIRDFVLGDKLEIAAFKGLKLTIRKWNHQLRQPILLTDGRTVVTASPQDGFLHRVTELDTLGSDEPETECRF